MADSTMSVDDLIAATLAQGGDSAAAVTVTPNSGENLKTKAASGSLV